MLLLFGRILLLSQGTDTLEYLIQLGSSLLTI
jgi:hypothetical protein